MPTSTRVWFSCSSGNCPEAITAFDNVLSRLPDHAAAWYQRGIAYEFLQDDQQAVESYEKARQFDPRNGELLFSEGKTFARLGKFEDAVRIFDLALGVSPDGGELFYEKGLALSASGVMARPRPSLRRLHCISRRNLNPCTTAAYP